MRTPPKSGENPPALVVPQEAHRMCSGETGQPDKRRCLSMKTMDGLLVINESLTWLHFLISNGWSRSCRSFSLMSFSSSDSPRPVIHDKFLRHFSNSRSSPVDDEDVEEADDMR